MQGPDTVAWGEAPCPPLDPIRWSWGGNRESSAPCQDVSRCGQLCASAEAVGEGVDGRGESIVTPAEGSHQDWLGRDLQ